MSYTEENSREPQPFRFLDLPPELRNVVYKALPRSVHRVELARYGYGARTPDQQLPAIWGIRRSLPVAILATCKQIHAEANILIQETMNQFVLNQPIRLMFELSRDITGQYISPRLTLNHLWNAIATADIPRGPVPAIMPHYRNCYRRGINQGILSLITHIYSPNLEAFIRQAAYIYLHGSREMHVLTVFKEWPVLSHIFPQLRAQYTEITSIYMGVQLRFRWPWLYNLRMAGFTFGRVGRLSHRGPPLQYPEDARSIQPWLKNMLLYLDSEEWAQGWCE